VDGVDLVDELQLSLLTVAGDHGVSGDDGVVTLLRSGVGGGCIRRWRRSGLGG
jgi:hypothetical protein